jgi:hypothetical protein
MNTQPLEREFSANTEHTISETDELVRNGFTSDEIISLLWLRQWYQSGGSDRVEVLRHFEFLKLLVVRDKIAL